MSLQNPSRGLEKFLKQCEKENPVENLKVRELHFDAHFQVLKGSITTVVSVSNKVTCTKRKDLVIKLPAHIPIHHFLNVSRSWFIKATKLSADEYKLEQFIRPIMLD